MIHTIQPRYTEVLYNIMIDERGKKALDDALSEYPLYESKSLREFGAPNIIPTREELNKAILNHYKYREIGTETIGRFLDELKISMNEIMPKYNQLYFSADQDYNIIYNVDYRKTIDRNLNANTNTESIGNTQNNETSESEASQRATSNTTVESSDTTESSTENYNKSVKSLTPQNQLSITNKQIDSVDYADEVNWNHDSAESEATNEGSSTSSGTTVQTNTSNTENNQNTDTTLNTTGNNEETEGIVETTKGNFGVVSAQDLILKYRETIINITQQLINDPRITELFMLVY